MRALLSWLKPYFIIFLVLQTLLRISLFVRSSIESNTNFGDFVQAMGRGLWLDVATASFVLIPAALLFCFSRMPQANSRFSRGSEKTFRFIFTYLLLFDFIAEHLFWSEFDTRFNFIAVDYLVYTNEVIGNIMESYPIGWMLSAIAVLGLLITWVSYRLSAQQAHAPKSLKLRGLAIAGYAAICVLLYSASNVGQAQFGDNAEAGEVASNGVYNLFYAFWHNEIDYSRFYYEKSKPEVASKIRDLLHEKNAQFEGDGITRLVTSKGREMHKNVIIVSMESMSASYMQTFGNKEDITPNLDSLAKQGLLFSNLYATGTRTVRGLEAITLSVPPTPGQSIVRRPDNANLFSLGFIFKDRGYDTKFIYGGYGYFDNMNTFFSGNGFDVVDRTNLAKDEIQFANIWGVSDEDLFARALKEADKSVAEGKPFMQLIMTTSNHRPYTYPENKIDIPSKSSRLGGVKYADYSVGKLVEWASKKPWFKDTVFVFVADHTAGASGKAELAPEKYHIPMIFYSPGFIEPGNFKEIASQIDLAPTLLGVLNFHYRSKFYGEDLLHDDDEVPHAFISNYQKIALVKEGEMTLLAPKRQVRQFKWPEEETEMKKNDELIYEAVAYYQSASWWRDSYRRVPTVITQQAQKE